MRISDWSSDVCSSDLSFPSLAEFPVSGLERAAPGLKRAPPGLNAGLPPGLNAGLAAAVGVVAAGAGAGSGRWNSRTTNRSALMAAYEEAGTWVFVTGISGLDRIQARSPFIQT